MLYNTFTCFPVEFLASTQVRSAPYVLSVGNTPMKELGPCMHVGLQPLNNLLLEYKSWDGEHQSLWLGGWDSLWTLPEFAGHHQNHSLFIYNVTEHQWEVTRKADSIAIFKKGDRWELVITGTLAQPSRYCKTLPAGMKLLTLLRRELISTWALLVRL